MRQVFDDWTPIESAGDDGCPLSRAQRERIIRRLEDGLLKARARRAVIVERTKIYAGVSHITDPIAAVLASNNFEWGEPTTSHEVDFELSAAAWSADKLGIPSLELWETGEARMADPYSAAPGYEGDRATFYGIELAATNCSIGGEGKSKRGRTKGSGSFEAADAFLMVRMRELIEKGEAFSPDEAAKRVASLAPGGGTEISKATRLAKRYRNAEKK